MPAIGIPEENIPNPIPQPEPIPDGSIAEDTNYFITDENLNILTNTIKSKLLAVSNLGSTTTSKINNALDLIRTYEDLEVYTLDHTLLNSLANTTATSNYTVTNLGSSNFAKVIIILGEITPIGTAKVRIKNNLNFYELTIPNTTSKKRIEFEFIPISFVSSFQVENQTGTTFASSGNSIIVQGL